MQIRTLVPEAGIVERCHVRLFWANQEGHDGHQEEDRGPKLRRHWVGTSVRKPTVQDITTYFLVLCWQRSFVEKGIVDKLPCVDFMLDLCKKPQSWFSIYHLSIVKARGYNTIKASFGKSSLHFKAHGSKSASYTCQAAKTSAPLY